MKVTEQSVSALNYRQDRRIKRENINQSIVYLAIIGSDQVLRQVGHVLAMAL